MDVFVNPQAPIALSRYGEALLDRHGRVDAGSEDSTHPAPGSRASSFEENLPPAPVPYPIKPNKFELPVPGPGDTACIVLRYHSSSTQAPNLVQSPESESANSIKGILKEPNKLSCSRKPVPEVLSKTWSGTAPRSLLPVLKAAKDSKKYLETQGLLKASLIPSISGSTIRQRSSIPKLHVSFVTPKGTADGSGSPGALEPHSPILRGQNSPTRAKAPVLLTQLRADRHKQLEMVSQRKKKGKGKTSAAATGASYIGPSIPGPSTAGAINNDGPLNGGIHLDLPLRQGGEQASSPQLSTSPGSSQDVFYTCHGSPMRDAASNLHKAKCTPGGSPAKSDGSGMTYYTALEDFDGLDLTSDYLSRRSDVAESVEEMLGTADIGCEKIAKPEEDSAAASMVSAAAARQQDSQNKPSLTLSESAVISTKGKCDGEGNISISRVCTSRGSSQSSPAPLLTPPSPRPQPKLQPLTRCSNVISEASSTTEEDKHIKTTSTSPVAETSTSSTMEGIRESPNSPGAESSDSNETITELHITPLGSHSSQNRKQKSKEVLAPSPSNNSSLTDMQPSIGGHDIQPTMSELVFQPGQVSFANAGSSKTLQSSKTMTKDSSTVRLGAASGSSDSNLRATAVAFVPENAKPRAGDIVGSWEKLANHVHSLVGPPDLYMVPPICPPKTSTNQVRLVYPFGPGPDDGTWIHEGFRGQTPMMDYIEGMDLSYTYREPWHKIVSQAVNNNPEALSTESFRVQIPDRRKVPAVKPAGPFSGTPLTPRELMQLDNDWHKDVMNSMLKEDMRTPADIVENGPGPYPHVTMTTRPLSEKFRVGPIRPGQHRNKDCWAMPNARAQEWWEIAEAIKLINLEVLEREVRRSNQFEPPIPTGFAARANFNQPGRDRPVPKAPLRGGGQDEFDWVDVPIEGCRYCGDDRHETHACKLMRRHIEHHNVQCINCHHKGHFLRDCTNPPVFNNMDSRSRKMQLYAHTEHWRRTLHKQHSEFAAAIGYNKPYPELKENLGDASLAFAWLACPDCKPELHWKHIKAIEEDVRYWCDEDDSLGASEPYWNTPEWVYTYDSCPVIWSLMHEMDRSRCWVIVNPLDSVAVDAFWRTNLKAMGWDAPDLPDSTGDF